MKADNRSPQQKFKPIKKIPEDNGSIIPTKRLSVALLGNPNVGKTSIFNALTGARQYVGNWPGVTVEKRIGIMYHNNIEFKITDLPGTYTLSATSPDEKIARDFLLYESPDIVIVISDAINLERSLYLLLQVLELRGDVILVINAIDEAKKSGIYIDKAEVEKHLGIPIVLTSAVTGEGIPELKNIMSKMKEGKVHVHYVFDHELEEEISRISSILVARRELKNYDARWLAIKILEGDAEIQKLTGIEINRESSQELAVTRYRFIKQILRDAYSRKTKTKWDLNTAIDHVITHKFLGLLIFLIIMYSVFQLTFSFGAPFSSLIEEVVEGLAGFFSSLIPVQWLSSLISDGIISGVGAVLVFVPNIFILFLALGILEESGYLPRAAFVIDRIMYAMKLSGRSFMSMILGFGCNVSSIMAARAINEPQERITTILVSPFISCSARLPVYVLIAGTFFGAKAGLVVFSLYILSIVFTVLSALFFNKLLYKGKPAPMIMELPRYRRPTVKSLLIYTWNRGKHFLEKAGTIIFAASIIIWFLSYFPSAGNVHDSYAAILGRVLEPLFRPIGFSWQIVTSLVFGIAAKEVIVSTLTMFYSTGANLDGGTLTLVNSLTPPTAFAFLIFVLLYVPCIATLVVMKNETGSLKYLIISVVYSFTLAYVMALLFSFIGGYIL
ncbi:ferrous iron transport protein B [Kosmotoga sp.]|uniref:ferrous iron transport protein B n=1 Tax=Kosmotoga sp. TaxID=1955248 RepID=UPI0024ABDAC9|nr:ferrous iron transport protein B [Kosmotoga sp.]MDI3523575.1 ferrous iron transport protein [Kosmotoga sp.]